jgi:dephospho-CoA kinase
VRSIYCYASTNMKKLIGISGATASGKTTIAQKLIVHFGADTARFSAILAGIAQNLGLPTDKPALQHLSTVLREKLGEDVLARGMCEWVRKNPAETIIIEGIRRKTDIDLLEKIAEETNRSWIFLYIDVSSAVRFARMNKRLQSEGKSPISQESFDALEHDECEIELPLIKPRAHAVLENETRSSEATAGEAIAFIERQ